MVAMILIEDVSTLLMMIKDSADMVGGASDIVDIASNIVGVASDMVVVLLIASGRPEAMVRIQID